MSSTLVESPQQETVQLSARVADLSEQLDGVRRQLEWFKRQFFGRTSERRREFDDVARASLFGALGIEVALGAEAPTEQLRYERRKKCRDGALNELGLRFDDSVPVETVIIIDSAVEAIPEAEREVVGEKVTHRQAQESGTYKVIRHVRSVVKRHDTGQMVSASAPANVLERSAVDMSFLGGMMVDKFRCHLPLHCQHQRLADCGIRVSRRSLMNWAGRAIHPLAPVDEAQSAHILTSRVLAMDETTTRAECTQAGKMRTGYGKADELVIHYALNRAHEHVETLLTGFRSTLLSDGYAAYARRHALPNARCWSHCRRTYIDEQDCEPEAVAEALKLIGVPCTQDRTIDTKFTDPAKLAHRREHRLPSVKAFFVWCEQQRQRPDLLPRNPLASALQYATHREAGLRVLLDNFEVSIDTNHFKPSLSSIPTGRRNCLFAWTGLRAQRKSIIRSMLVICRLHNVDTYIHIVDFLQRIEEQPAKRISETTLRVWKRMFANHPFESDLAGIRPRPTQ